jgi:DNA-directed RNA polymerase subunit RPC12/RpoP
MKPSSKLQREILAISKKLPPISPRQMEYGYKNCTDKWALLQRKTTYCTECGHGWKNDQEEKAIICPQCGSRLMLKKEYENTFKDKSYYSIITTRKGMQVVRMFWVQKTFKRGMAATYFMDEVMQHWITKEGKLNTLSKRVNGMSFYADAWIFDSPLEFHGVASHRAEFRYGLGSSVIYPRESIIPVLKRNGYKRINYDIAIHRVFIALLTKPLVETLVKAGQVAMAGYAIYNPDQVKDLWPTLRVCLRNGYIIKDHKMWLDTLYMIKRKHRTDAQYVCPDDLKALHDRLMNEKEERTARRMAEEQRELQVRHERAIEDFATRIQKYLDLRFTDNEITVAPLKTVEEFLEEGRRLHHCVHTNSYYAKADSLVLSARIDNNPVETIEVSLREMRVVQCRGLQNQTTEYHDRIVKLVNNNMNQILKRAS